MEIRNDEIAVNLYVKIFYINFLKISYKKKNYNNFNIQHKYKFSKHYVEHLLL